MQRIWTVALLAVGMLACQTRLHWQLGQAPGAGTPPPAAMSPENEPHREEAAQRMAEARARRQREAVQSIVDRYDAALDVLDEADRLVKTKQLEQATVRYRDARAKATELVAWFSDEDHRLGRGAKVRYGTQHDGTLDEAGLVGNLRDAGQRAGDAADRTWNLVVARLVKELGARSKIQRDTLRERGRPEVHRTKRETCWIYRAPDGDDAFCWRKTGTLARRDRNPKPPEQVARTQVRPPRRANAPVTVAANDDAGSPQPEAAPAASPPQDTAPAPEPAAAPAPAQKPDCMYCKIKDVHDYGGCMNAFSDHAEQTFCIAVAQHESGRCANINDHDNSVFCQCTAEPSAYPSTYCENIQDPTIKCYCLRATGGNISTCGAYLD